LKLRKIEVDDVVAPVGALSSGKTSGDVADVIEMQVV